MAAEDEWSSFDSDGAQSTSMTTNKLLQSDEAVADDVPTRPRAGQQPSQPSVVPSITALARPPVDFDDPSPASGDPANVLPRAYSRNAAYFDFDEPDQWELKRSLRDQLLGAHLLHMALAVCLVCLVVGLVTLSRRPTISNQAFFLLEQIATWLAVRALVYVGYQLLDRWFRFSRFVYLIQTVPASITFALWAVGHLGGAAEHFEHMLRLKHTTLHTLYIGVLSIGLANVAKHWAERLWLIAFHIEVLAPRLNRLLMDEQALDVLQFAVPSRANCTGISADWIAANARSVAGMPSGASHDNRDKIHALIFKGAATKRQRYYNNVDLMRTDAELAASNIMANADRGRKGYITLADIDMLTKSDEDTLRVLQTFSSFSEDQLVTQLSFDLIVQTIMSIYAAHESLHALVHDRAELSTVLQRFTSVFFFMAAGLFSLVYVLCRARYALAQSYRAVCSTASRFACVCSFLACYVHAMMFTACSTSISLTCCCLSRRWLSRCRSCSAIRSRTPLQAYFFSLSRGRSPWAIESK